jgi:hypothetical protein
MVSSSYQRNPCCLAGVPLPEALFVLTLQTAIRQCLIGARDLIIDGVHIAELAYQPSYS